MQELYNSELCVRCKGRGYCGKPCKILAKIKNFFPKSKKHFSGSSPPEVFIGRIGYPQLNTGILAPQEITNTEKMSLPELWYKNNFSIKDIVNYRSQLIYSKFKSKVKDPRKKTKFLTTMQEISMAEKSVSSEIWLKKPVSKKIYFDKHLPIIGNPAPLQNIKLQENPKIQKKIDYLVNDTDNKATSSIIELYQSKIYTSNIIKILSAGLLGLKKNRKLVPTRWSVTATDDTISKFLLKKIKTYNEINEIKVFHNYYVGNHYEFLLLPGNFEFEVIEAFLPSSVWNLSSQITITKDFETFFNRKKYASNVTGAYYTARLVVSEYLEKIKKQATILVFREERPEYNAPLGVGILRELGRAAFQKKPETFSTLHEAFKKINTRLKLGINYFIKNSKLLKQYGKQKKLNQFF